MSLAPCTQCQRHVRVTDPQCPFCGAALSGLSAKPAPSRGLKRAALLALSASVAAAGCGEDSDDDGSKSQGASSSSSSTTKPSSPSPGSSPVTPTPTTTDPGPSIQPLYGAVAVGSTEPEGFGGAPDKGGGGSAMPLYGAPAAPERDPQDGFPDDDLNAAPR
ncbi:MAG TPA: hypothetical protein VHM70_25280 [Polyangiaceae bacterium]|jgi:hypothetical protein|nr:hypothetical protein [Polyangiaceae bacterium]